MNILQTGAGWHIALYWLVLGGITWFALILYKRSWVNFTRPSENTIKRVRFIYIEILSELMKWLFVKYSWKPTAVMRIVAVFGGFYTFHWKGFRSQPKTPKEFRPCLAMNFKADLGILLLELHVSVVRWKINWEKGDSVKTTRLGLFCTLFSSQLKLSASLSISDNRSIFLNYLGWR